jgi:hypothetical protein
LALPPAVYARALQGELRDLRVVDAMLPQSLAVDFQRITELPAFQFAFGAILRRIGP